MMMTAIGKKASGATLVPPKILESSEKLLTGKTIRRAFHRMLNNLSEKAITPLPDP
jgi:hypothetical protein